MLRLVALDMDGTLVDVESSWAAIHHHFRDHNADGLRDFLAGRITIDEFIRTDIRICGAMPPISPWRTWSGSSRPFRSCRGPTSSSAACMLAGREP